MENFHFKIEEETLCVNSNELSKDTFTIKSIPKNYLVRLTDRTPLDEVQRLLDERPTNLLVIDKKVKFLHFNNLDIDNNRIFLAEATEEFKSLTGGTMPLIDWLSNRGITKADKLIVIGGGIIQDVSAFVACVFKRGIPWVFFPTTLLSMCDSCIGGKAGINHGNYKNQIALFSAPKEVILSMDFLKTLPDREIKSGLGEILKLHITGGPYFLNKIDEHFRDGNPLPSSLQILIWNALLVKKSVIEIDEFESHLRKSLNYGHTIGHAIESITNFEIPHGTAISIGMLLVNQLAVNRGILDPQINLKINSYLRLLVGNANLKLVKSINVVELSRALSRDKKNTGTMLTLIVISNPGEIKYITIENNETFSAELKDIISALE